MYDGIQNYVRLRCAQVWHMLSTNIAYLRAYRTVQLRTERTVPALSSPLVSDIHLPSPEDNLQHGPKMRHSAL